MRDETVAKSYAETLFDLAKRHEGPEAFGEAIEMVAGFVEQQPAIREFVETPRISAAQKKAALTRAVGGEVPPMFLNFLKVVFDKRRQRLLRAIAGEYAALLDEHLGRSYVEVTVARPLDEKAADEVAKALSKATGKTVIPRLHVDPQLLGGIVIREGDTVYDGSVKRRLDQLRRRLMAAELPAPAGGE